MHPDRGGLVKFGRCATQGAHLVDGGAGRRGTCRPHHHSTYGTQCGERFHISGGAAPWTTTGKPGGHGRRRWGHRRALQVHYDTAPDLLPHLDFSECERVYQQWRSGQLSMSQVRLQHGREVADLVEAQKVVSDMEDNEFTSDAKPVTGTPCRNVLCCALGSPSSGTGSSRVCMDSGRGMSAAT